MTLNSVSGIIVSYNVKQSEGLETLQMGQLINWQILGDANSR